MLYVHSSMAIRVVKVLTSNYKCQNEAFTLNVKACIWAAGEVWKRFKTFCLFLLLFYCNEKVIKTYGGRAVWSQSKVDTPDMWLIRPVVDWSTTTLSPRC